MATIEQIWQGLRAGGEGSRQRRVDATHPLDLYSGFPRLTVGSVPAGVKDADYTITLPHDGRTIIRGMT